MTHPTIPLGHGHLRLARKHAAKSALGGTSHVRPDTDARQDNLGVDQLTGHLGNLALSLYWYGTTHPYVMGRTLQDKFPTVGDGGSDLPGLNVDVKTSLIRKPDPTLQDYNLIVRPRELHPGTVYVLCLIERQEYPPDNAACLAHLMGWADARTLENAGVASYGTFAGAFTIPAMQLTPLPPLTYEWSV